MKKLSLMILGAVFMAATAVAQSPASGTKSRTINPGSASTNASSKNSIAGKNKVSKPRHKRKTRKTTANKTNAQPATTPGMVGPGGWA